MAEATTTHGFWELMRIARWHVEGDALDRAPATAGGREPRRRGTPLDHRQNDPPLQWPARQPAPRRVHALEERRFWLLELGRFDVFVEGRRRGRG